MLNRARDILKTLEYHNIEVFISDGSEGLARFAPFDRISVAAAAPEIPKPLVEQLKDGGKMVVPVGTYYQELKLVEQEGDTVRVTNRGAVAFVPLIGKYGFR